MKIQTIRARRILDSRGDPTVEAYVRLEDGSQGVASAPSGASTGSHEAFERRDGGQAYSGKDVKLAIDAVNGEIAERLIGMDAADQRAVDQALRALDGTSDLSRLGGNAAIAVSMAVCCAAAEGRHVPLYRQIRDAFSIKDPAGAPCPAMNVLNGGLHANNDLDIQEFMLLPVGAEDFAAAVQMGCETARALRDLLRMSGRSTAVGDEGGFAPDMGGDERAIEFLVMAIERAGYAPGKDIALALDVAAAGWQDGRDYVPPKSGVRVNRSTLSARILSYARRYPVVSVEDPLGEDDFEGFAHLTEALRGTAMVVGDDLFTTNAARVTTGIAKGSATTLLVKPNQAGTLSSAMDAALTARAAGMKLMVSHRSGETESSFIADLSFALGAEYMKSGAPVRGERTAKYNRMLLLAAGGWENIG